MPEVSVMESSEIFSIGKNVCYFIFFDIKDMELIQRNLEGILLELNSLKEILDLEILRRTEYKIQTINIILKDYIQYK